MNEDYRNQESPLVVTVWLFIICAMILGMVLLGGVTRLTGSGLSMVDWKPLVRWLPPLNHEQWMELFTLYKASPEYQKINYGMSLDNFKSIFWLEFLHRLWGRLIGLFFLLPLLLFIIKGWIGKKLRNRLVLIFILGGIQGGLGWYMVKSGLVDHPDVSAYRLTAHLGLAVIIYALTLWGAFSLALKPQGACFRMQKVSFGILSLVFIVILSGGFVAGLDAGFAYNTFPLMNERFVPEGYFQGEPWFLSGFQDIATVQFNHRLLAILTALIIFLLWVIIMKNNTLRAFRLIGHCLLIGVGIQVTLGISTLLLAVPVWLAATHQLGAFILFSIALWLFYHTKSPALHLAAGDK